MRKYRPHIIFFSLFLIATVLTMIAAAIATDAGIIHYKMAMPIIGIFGAAMGLCAEPIVIFGGAIIGHFCTRQISMFTWSLAYTVPATFLILELNAHRLLGKPFNPLFVVAVWLGILIIAHLANALTLMFSSSKNPGDKGEKQ